MLEEFIAEIEAYLERTQMPKSVFGRKAVGDPTFLIDLGSGRSPSIRLVEKAREFMRTGVEHVPLKNREDAA